MIDSQGRTEEERSDSITAACWIAGAIAMMITAAWLVLAVRDLIGG